MKSSIRLLLPFAIAAAVSCNKKSYLHAGEEPVAAKDSGHWRLVKEDPPTMFPEGYPADGGTESTDGEWIQGSGVRRFVPAEGVKGVSQRELTREALAMQSSAEQQWVQMQKAGFTAQPSLAQIVTGLGMGVVHLGVAVFTQGIYSPSGFWPTTNSTQ